MATTNYNLTVMYDETTHTENEVQEYLSNLFKDGGLEIIPENLSGERKVEVKYFPITSIADKA